MDIYRPHIARVFIAPHDIQKVVPAVDFIRIKSEELQDIKLLRGQINLPVPDEDPTAVNIQPQITGLNNLFLLLGMSLVILFE